MIIEQQQIVTTQNLAALFARTDLRGILANDLGNMARRNFEWICRQLQQKFATYYHELVDLKNSAYAWRQLIFFLALLSRPQIDEFLDWAKEVLTKQPESFRERFEPVLEGLAIAARRVGAGQGRQEPTIRQFLGWSKSTHWLSSGRVVDPKH